MSFSNRSVPAFDVTMKMLLHPLLILLVWILPVLSSAQDVPEAFAPLMTAEEFTAAGLHRLSPEEQAFLAKWMRDKVDEERLLAVEDVVPSGDDAFGLEQVTARVARIFRNTPDVIESHIEGKFTGWEGNTTFRLANGQVWQQADAGRFYYPTRDPKVIIRKAAFGSYLLRIEGKGSTVRVRRIE